jgi:hypothetical protein
MSKPLILKKNNPGNLDVYSMNIRLCAGKNLTAMHYQRSKAMSTTVQPLSRQSSSQKT